MAAVMPVQGERRRVLMLAYYFPPLGGGGVQRTAKYVKYLPEHGFDPIVVAGSRGAFFLRDEQLGSDVPSGTPVSRARVLPLHRIEWKLDGLLRRLGLPRAWANGALWPDEFAGWLPASVVQSLRMVEAHSPDVLYTTSLPATAHLAGLVVQKLTGLPWVADFRDSFVMNPLEGDKRAVGLRGAANRALERAVVEHASCVTFADDTMGVHGLSVADPRRVVIPNGVDPDDVDGEPGRLGAGLDDRFRLTYVGSLYGRHDAAEMFAAIRRLIDSGTLDPQRFELRIVGHASLEPSTLDSLPIVRTGYVEHRRALQEMSNATALLYSRPAGDLVASGKIFEYLCAGRPILCVADPGSLAYGLVGELGAGSCADVRDPGAIEHALGRMVASWRAGELASDPEVRSEALRRFSRRRLAGSLA